MKLYTFFNFAGIAAAEKRPLSYKTPQSVHRPRYCGVQTFPLKMHYGGENWGKLGKEWSDFDPQRKGSYFWGSGLWCKVSSKLSEICDRRRGDRRRQTERTDTRTRVITAQCTLVQMRGLGIACRPSVCLSVCLSVCDVSGL